MRRPRRRQRPKSGGSDPTGPNYLPTSLLLRPESRTGPVGFDHEDAPENVPVANHMEIMSEIIRVAEDAADIRARMGAAALEWRRRQAELAERSGAPPSPLSCAATTGRKGRCSSWLSMPIPVNRWCSTATAESTWWTLWPLAVPMASVSVPTASAMTGTSTVGTEPSRNADLAAGYGRVLVLSPFGGRSRTPVG